MKEIYESILDSIKKMIGVDKDYGAFDVDLIIAINGVFTILNQLGVGPEKEYSIAGPDETWLEFFGVTDAINLVKPYMYLKCKLIFDPPSSGVLNEALERQIAEYEWRIMIQADPASKPDDGEDPSDPGDDKPTPDTPVEETIDHQRLINRDLPDQHPMVAITGLTREVERIPEVMSAEEMRNILLS